MITADITGMDDLAKALDGIKKRVQTKIGTEAVVTALTPLVDAAQHYAGYSKETGALKDSIGIKSKPYRRGKVIFGVVGPRNGFKRPDPSGKGFRDPRKYAHLVEFGTPKAAPVPFMRPAFAETKDFAIQEMARVIGDGVKREAELQASKRKNKGKR